ncbi:MAG: hypothetical protein V4714_17045 [Bacteroidota bacterium]
MEEKKYVQDGKTIKIIPIKKVKKLASAYDDSQPVEKEKKEKKERVKKSEPGLPKFAVDDKVCLKPIPPEYAGCGFAESIIIKVFKSTHDHMYRYSIRSLSGQELAMLKEEQLKTRKINFKK